MILTYGLMLDVDKQNVSEPVRPWRVLYRASVDEDFPVPEGWEAVEVTEANQAEYISQVRRMEN
jgi:hypothetical protein